MARMTKLQIDYMRNKIDTKLRNLVAKKARKISESGEMTLHELEKAMQKKEVIKWAKERTKAQLVNMINEDGKIIVNRPYKGYRQTVIDQIREAELEPSVYSDFNSFVGSKRVRPLLDQIEKNEKKLSDYKAALDKEAEELMDTIVLSGSANGVKYAISKFMDK